MSDSLSFPLHRVFLAIPLEGNAKERYRELQQRLQEHENIFTFQNADSPHLTLQYWEEVMQIEWQPLLHQAEKIAAATEPFSLKLEGVKTFGRPGQERVLFLDIPFSEDLARLKKRCPWPQ